MCLQPRDAANEAWLRACTHIGKTPSLTAIANHYGSDKGTIHGSAHGYSRLYSRLFEPIRYDDITLFEIGIGVEGKDAFGTTVSDRNPGGASLKMWREYFPHAQIYAMDLNDASMFEGERVHTFVGNQGNPEDLKAAMRAISRPLDVAVDDGSHASRHQQLSLAYLFPFVKPGGLYLIEDLHWQPQHLEAPDDQKTRDVLQSVTSVPLSNHIARHHAAYVRDWLADVHFWPRSGAAAKVAVLHKALAPCAPSLAP